MALGDEIVRTDNATPPADSTDVVGPVPLTDNLEQSVDTVRTIGDQATADPAPPEMPDVDMQETTEARTLAENVVANRQEVPEDDAMTPEGVPSPEEGKRLGDAIKKTFEALGEPGARQALEQMGVRVEGASPQSPRAPTAPPERVGREVTPDTIANNVPDQPVDVPTEGQEQAAQQAVEGGGGGGGGLGQQLLSALGNRNVQRALISLGSSIDPEGQGPLGQFGQQFISQQAQAEFRERLNRGESPGQAAQQTEGLTPEGQSTVLQQFRSERQREAERDIAREELEQRRTEAEVDALLTAEELGLEREALEQEGALARREIALRERDQDLQEEMAGIERQIAQSEIDLNEARAQELEASAEGRQLRQQLERATEVSQIAGERANTVQERLQETQTQLDQRIGALPEAAGSTFGFGGTNVQTQYRNLVNEAEQAAAESDDLSFQEAFTQRSRQFLNEVPESARADVQRVLALESQRRGLQQRLNNLTNTQREANQIVMSAFRSGSEGQTSGGEGSQVKSFNSVEEARGNVSPGEVVQIGGRQVRVEMGDDGNLKGIPVQ